jgi:acyl-coenzyme A thioesterase PaaI-like protein
MSSQAIPPPIVKQANWQEVTLPFNIGSGRTLFAGLENDSRLRLRIYRLVDDGSLVGRVWFGNGADGPPLHAHGGAIAYVMDEAMGAAGWMSDYPVVAARLQFGYFRMTPLEVDLHLEARVLKVTEKRVEIEARLLLPTGEICVVSSGEFAILSRTKIPPFNEAQLDPQGLIKNPKLKWAPDDAS